MLIFLRLTKAPLCLLIGCSALFGFLYSRPDRWGGGLLAALFVFCLAAGGATFNSIQERHHDGAMIRTRKRPLVTGDISVGAAVGTGLLLACCGFFGMWFIFNVFAAILGLLALLLYNCVYTPLKKVSIIALIPGAICGGLPPVIGLVCTGVSIASLPVLLVFSLLFLWQFPHFWLVMLMHREDYDNSSLPNFFHYFSAGQLKRLFVPWIGALAFAMLLFAAGPTCIARLFRILVLANSIIMVLSFLLSPTVWHDVAAKKLFYALNLFLLLHMVFVVWGRMLC